MEEMNQQANGTVGVRRERHVVSLLVRFWLESREESESPAPVRGYIRHLQTGEECYINDPGMVEEYLLDRLYNHPATPLPRSDASEQ